MRYSGLQRLLPPFLRRYILHVEALIEDAVTALAEEIPAALDLINYQVSDKGIQVVVACPPDLPRVPANREFVRRVIVTTLQAASGAGSVT